MWQFHNFFDPAEFRRRFNRGEETIADAIATYRNAKAVFNYLNIPRVHRNMITVLNNLRGEFRMYQNQWNSLHPTETIDLVAYWDIWIRDFLRTFQTSALASAERGYAALLEMAPANGGDTGIFAAGLIMIHEWVDEIRAASISDTGLE
jgi:hypothetical protein